MFASVNEEQHLVAGLDQHGVIFLAKDNTAAILASPLTINELISGLAQSEAARVRLALIPLFLKSPDAAVAVPNVDKQLTGIPLSTLRCFYTAAYYLQQRNHADLQNQRLTHSLPNLYFPGLAMLDDPLQGLAGIHADQVNKPLNWYGTYHHAYKQWSQFEKRRTGLPISPNHY